MTGNITIEFLEAAVERMSLSEKSSPQHAEKSVGNSLRGSKGMTPTISYGTV
jgi:hypothetical protein